MKRVHSDPSERIPWTKEVPVKQDCDVLVVGGGISGVCAACAAANEGASAILVEHFGVLGGNGTAGGVHGFCGETKGQGHVFDEIVAGLERFNAIAPHRPARSIHLGARRFDHEILALVLQEVCLRHGVVLMLHTRFIDAVRAGAAVSHALVAGKSGIEAIRARMFVDCTGEADVVQAIGCETMKGRPSDGMQLPMSLMFFTRLAGWGRSRRAVPRDFFPWRPFASRDDLPMTSFGRCGLFGRSVKVKVPSFDATSTESLTSAEVQGRRKAMQVLEYYQRAWHKPWELDHVASIIGIREGRRVVGEYVLTVDDVRAGREFDDAVAVGSYPLDAHDPGDDKRTYILPKDQLGVPGYHIPLRSLIPRGTANLLVAGRNLSADQLAMSSARVMATCAMMGTAAGITASMCIKKGLTPTELATAEPAAVREAMAAGGAIFDLAFYTPAQCKKKE
ncbi:MAG: FAD-dependent oxidoreductase [Candidatus Lokiarchaeota archaeon]|nr:FAD-dependent oxidoreductase [Candidatus Lokiarchaeota archaeon]